MCVGRDLKSTNAIGMLNTNVQTDNNCIHVIYVINWSSVEERLLKSSGVCEDDGYRERLFDL